MLVVDGTKFGGTKALAKFLLTTNSRVVSAYDVRREETFLIHVNDIATVADALWRVWQSSSKLKTRMVTLKNGKQGRVLLAVVLIWHEEIRSVTIKKKEYLITDARSLLEIVRRW